MLYSQLLQGVPSFPRGALDASNLLSHHRLFLNRNSAFLTLRFFGFFFHSTAKNPRAALLLCPLSSTSWWQLYPLCRTRQGTGFPPCPPLAELPWLFPGSPGRVPLSAGQVEPLFAGKQEAGAAPRPHIWFLEPVDKYNLPQKHHKCTAAPFPERKIPLVGNEDWSHCDSPGCGLGCAKSLSGLWNSHSLISQLLLGTTALAAPAIPCFSPFILMLNLPYKARRGRDVQLR